MSENILFVSLLDLNKLLSFMFRHRDVIRRSIRLGSLSLIRGEISHSAPELCSSLVHYTLLRLK